MAMENSDDIMVETIIRDPKKYKNLVPPTDCKDDTFMEVVEWVKNGNRLKKTVWINGYVYICDDATEDIGNERGKKDLSLEKKPVGFNNDDYTDEEDNTRDFPNEDDRSREDVDENPVNAERDNNAENLADEEDTARKDLAKNLTEETKKIQKETVRGVHKTKKAPERSCKNGAEKKEKREENSSKSEADGERKMPKRACKAHAQAKQKNMMQLRKKKGTNKGVPLNGLVSM
ncbi:hypothetical protein Rs2_29202 [Raphanus sativus]|nr:hypothetical protein Rs2_29202 [Raphanus sativus]